MRPPQGLSHAASPHGLLRAFRIANLRGGLPRIATPVSDWGDCSRAQLITTLVSECRTRRMSRTAGSMALP
eukprot:8577136-Alexandrium_andersonii.AAC.1